MRIMFDFQPTLKGTLVELSPLRAQDEQALFLVASDPLIWGQRKRPLQAGGVQSILS